MPKKKYKPGEEWRRLAREANRRELQRRREKLIPDEVLRKLASLSLPNSEWIYDACLRKAIAEYRLRQGFGGQDMAKGA